MVFILGWNTVGQYRYCSSNDDIKVAKDFSDKAEYIVILIKYIKSDYYVLLYIFPAH